MTSEAIGRARVVGDSRANDARIEDHYRRLWDVPVEDYAAN